MREYFGVRALRKLARYISSPRRYCWALFLSVLAARMILIAVTFEGNAKTPFWEDAVIAENLVSGRGYSMAYDVLPCYIWYDCDYKNPPLTAVKPPLYPLFIAANYVIFGIRNFFSIYLTQAILASISPIILYLATRRTLKEMWAKLLAFAFAFYPAFLIHPCVRLEASWLLLLLLSIGIFILLFPSKPERGWIVSAGVLTGLVVMLDPVPAPALALAYLFRLWIFPVNWRTRLCRAILLVFCILAVMVPWQIRNLTVFGRVVLKSSTASSLLYGFCQNNLPLPSVPADWNTLAAKGVLAQEKAAWPLIQEHLNAHPGLLKRHIILNLKHYYGMIPPKKWGLGATLAKLIPQWSLQAGSLAALLFALFRRDLLRTDEIKVILMWCIGTIGITTLTYGFIGAWNERYKFPFEMALLILLFSSISTIRRRKEPTQAEVARGDV